MLKDGGGSNKKYYLYNGRRDTVQLTGINGNACKEYGSNISGNKNGNHISEAKFIIRVYLSFLGMRVTPRTTAVL
jgi:hypothetical protein